MYSTLHGWITWLRQTALESPRNTILTSIVSTGILVTSVVALIKLEGRRQHQAKKKHESHKRTPYVNKLPKGNNLNAPEPGKTIVNDFRKSININSSKRINKQIRIVTWNIERGYRINEIINELKKVNADIILLQEVDIGTERTNFLDVGNEIANALSYQIIYGSDCWHINQYHENDVNWNKNTNNKNVSYNSKPHNGCEGNAILTRFNITNEYGLIMPCVRNKYRPKHDMMKRHTAIVAVIDVPNIGELVCYSAHFDAFSGRIARSYVQYKTIYKDIIMNHIMNERGVIIGGDFNTHNHGVARFINEMSGDDKLRYKYWGISEAEWWDKYVIGKEKELFDDIDFKESLCLKDPFDKRKDVTAWKIWNGINVWSGKIDWLLYDVDRLIVVDKCVSDTDASDHQYLLCDIQGK